MAFQTFLIFPSPAFVLTLDATFQRTQVDSLTLFLLEKFCFYLDRENLAGPAFNIVPAFLSALAAAKSCIRRVVLGQGAVLRRTVSTA